MHVAGSTPGLCGNIAAGMKWSGKEPAHPVAQLVADRGPRAGDLEIADVMRHEAGARTEDGEVEAALAHQAQLVALDRFAQFVVADAQLGSARHLAQGC